MIVALALRPVPRAGRVAVLILVLAWLWTAIGFHWLHFAQINFAAGGYAALFALQGLLLMWSLVLKGRATFNLDRSPAALAALTVMICALFIYPAFDWWAGHLWPQWRLFGTALGTTMLFTLGVLLLASPRGTVPPACDTGAVAGDRHLGRVGAGYDAGFRPRDGCVGCGARCPAAEPALGRTVTP